MFDLRRARLSGKFDSRKDSHPMKLKRRPGIMVKLSITELRNPRVLFVPSKLIKDNSIELLLLFLLFCFCFQQN